jgi:elongation factor G
MKVEVITPDEFQGDILGDINRRRGQINNVESKQGGTTLRADVPLAEMFGYVNTLRSLSRGRAAYTMEPSHFAQVPTQILNAILEQKKG